MRLVSALEALGAAALFGLSPALAKRIGLPQTPLWGSALLYGGAGGALLLLLLGARLSGRRSREAGLRARDLPLLLAIVALGGLLGPVLLLKGLGHTAGSTAALLLNLEMIFTAGFAVVLFREHWDGKAGLGALLVLGGAAWLSLRPGATGERTDPLGIAAIAAACLCWGLDNNLTSRLADRDPRAIVAAKGLAAAGCATALAIGLGIPRPDGPVLWRGLVLGAASYGTSLFLYVRALRGLGAARTGALFATAPFAGALAAFALLGERPTAPLVGAGLVMAAGVAIFLRERHEHEHRHDAIEHEHRHVHDEHHRHAHRGDEGPEPHTHPHRHEPMVHSHSHAPDTHHRHRHG